LKYKGVEIVSPAEWNTVVDALDDLYDRIQGGLASFTGDGSTTEFKIAHGLGVKPTVALAGKGAANLPDIDFWDADETYVRVVFKSAPEAGSSVFIWWLAVK
jgi:hypothetical protein